MTMEIELTQGRIALIDDEDWPLVAGFKWYAWKVKGRYYARASLKTEGGVHVKVYMHRILLGLTNPKVVADHVDGNGLNNVRLNIRACSQAENRLNNRMYANNTSGFKGVSWNKHAKKWHAYIRMSGKRIHLGLFDTAEEAYAVRCAAATELHGDFANFGTPVTRQQEAAPKRSVR